MSRRDVVFLVADAGMEQMLRGFLGRAQVHRSVRCGPFGFDPREDLFVAPTKDPGCTARHGSSYGPSNHSIGARS